MIRGTTPVLEYRMPSYIEFENIHSAEIVISYSSGMKRILIVKDNNTNDFELDATNHIIRAKLTQQETLSLPVSNQVEVQLRIRLKDNTVLATKPRQIEVYKLLREGELE